MIIYQQYEYYFERVDTVKFCLTDIKSIFINSMLIYVYIYIGLVIYTKISIEINYTEAMKVY